MDNYSDIYFDEDGQMRFNSEDSKARFTVLCGQTMINFINSRQAKMDIIELQNGQGDLVVIECRIKEWTNPININENQNN